MIFLLIIVIALSAFTIGDLMGLKSQRCWICALLGREICEAGRVAVDETEKAG